MQNNPNATSPVKDQELSSRRIMANVAKQGIDNNENSIMQKPCNGV